MSKTIVRSLLFAFAGVLAASAPASDDAAWWAVPSMSGVQRLPDAIPADGERGGTVRIVAAHGGEIAVSSEAGRGTTFTVKLPRLEKRVRDLT